MPYLSERVAALPAKSIDLEFVSRSSLLTMEGQNGEYQCYKYVFTVPGTGETLEEKIFPPKGKTFPGSADQVLAKAQPGQICRATLNGKYLNWTVIPFGDAALDVPKVQSNYSAAKDAKTFTASGKEEDEKRHRIDISKIVFGYMNTEMAKGKSPEEAAAVAVDAYREQEKVIARILSKPDIGMDEMSS